MNEQFEQLEQVEKKELTELMERDRAAEQLYDEYNFSRITAEVGKHEDMRAYYQGKCEMLVKEKASQLEQLDLTKEQRDALIERYDEMAKECLREGKAGLCQYYRDCVDTFRQEQGQERKEQSQEWYRQFSAKVAKSQAELNATLQEQREWKAVHFAPLYR